MDSTNHFGEQNLSVFDAFRTKSRLVSCTYYQNASACWFLPLFSHDAHDLDNVITGFLLKHHLYFHHKGVEDLSKLHLLHLKSRSFENCLADFCTSAPNKLPIGRFPRKCCVTTFQNNLFLNNLSKIKYLSFFIPFCFVVSLAKMVTLSTNFVYKKSTQYRKYLWLLHRTKERWRFRKIL